MKTLSEFKDCLKNNCVFWNSHLFSTYEVEKKRTGIAKGYNCFGKRIILVFLSGE
jgi:hypothetical protein